MESVVGKDMLMAVLNELARANRGSVEVYSDLLGISLMKLDLAQGEIVSVADWNDFNVVLPGLRAKLKLNRLIAATLTIAFRLALGSSVKSPPPASKLS